MAKPVIRAPRVDDVCMAFYRFQTDAMYAAINRRNDTGQAEAIARARANLRVALAELGLDKSLDWTEKTGD